MTDVKKLKLHLDERGYLYEMLRSDDPFFKGFGQAYVSAINPGVVKGFHLHHIQTDHVVCVQGQIKLVLLRGPAKATIASMPYTMGELTIEEYHLSPLDPKMVMIPPGVWHAWKNVGTETALVVNFSDKPFDPKNPDEVRQDPDDNPWGYSWKVKNK